MQYTQQLLLLSAAAGISSYVNTYSTVQYSVLKSVQYMSTHKAHYTREQNSRDKLELLD